MTGGGGRSSSWDGSSGSGVGVREVQGDETTFRNDLRCGTGGAWLSEGRAGRGCRGLGTGAELLPGATLVPAATGSVWLDKSGLGVDDSWDGLGGGGGSSVSSSWESVRSLSMARIRRLRWPSLSTPISLRWVISRMELQRSALEWWPLPWKQEWYSYRLSSCSQEVSQSLSMLAGWLGGVAGGGAYRCLSLSLSCGTRGAGGCVGECGGECVCDNVCECVCVRACVKVCACVYACKCACVNNHHHPHYFIEALFPYHTYWYAPLTPVSSTTNSPMKTCEYHHYTHGPLECHIHRTGT